MALCLFGSTLDQPSVEDSTNLIALPSSQSSVVPQTASAIGGPAFFSVGGPSFWNFRGVQQRGPAPVRSTNPDAPIKLGINGFGRIGRQVARIAMDRKDFVLKHINSPMSPEYMKYQLEHDTV